MKAPGGLKASRLARGLSIAGHPAVVMPLSVLGKAMVGQASPALAAWAVAVTGLAAALVLGYSFLRVRSGDWEHMDASQPTERRQLNTVLAALLLGGALTAQMLGVQKPVVLGAGLCGAMVVLALLLRKQLKLSLHVAFAMFAAALWWPWLPAVGLGLAFAAGVAWSRLELRRHTRAEVVVGAAAGALFGAALQYSVAG